jgi:hypothetical protein
MGTTDDPKNEESQGDIETVILKQEPRDDGEIVTVVEAAKAISSVGLDILEPVGTILEDQATRMEGWRSFVKDIDSTYLRGLLVLDGAASLSLIACVLIFSFPDPIMWFLMELLVGVALLRYIRSSVTGKKIRRWLIGLSTGLLSIVWAYLLYNRIGMEPLFGSGTNTMRPEVPFLWVPVILHGMVGLGVWVHLALKKRLRASFEEVAGN